MCILFIILYMRETVQLCNIHLCSFDGSFKVSINHCIAATKGTHTVHTVFIKIWRLCGCSRQSRCIVNDCTTELVTHYTVDSPVRYAKFLLIRYFIDIDIFRNLLIDIDIFQNLLINIVIDIDIFQNSPINIDIDIFMIPLSISILIFLKDFLSISISIFFRIALSISISISIFSRIALSISISIFSKMTI